VKILTDEVTEVLNFQPTEAMERAKAAFHVAVQNSPLIDLRNVNVSQAVRLAGTSTLHTWWKKPGFPEWFLNEDTWRSHLVYLTSLALRTLERILVDDNPKSSAARVNAAKLILEAANKMPSKTREVRYLDKSVEDKSEEELRRMIQDSQKLLNISGGDSE